MRELIFAYLATRPEYARPNACRTGLVGPMRAYLWRHGAAQSGQWPDAPPHALALIDARVEASVMLADFCARCGRCEWGKQRDIRRTPFGLRDLSPAPDRGPGEDHGR
jgi:hypothetical protein